jgi:hypothetical protein
MPLEIYQMGTIGHPTFVVGLRIKNIVAFALGKMQAWGLTNDDMTADAWDYVHTDTYNFLPFLLRRVGAAPRWVWEAALALWVAALAGLAAAIGLLFQRMAHGEFEPERLAPDMREASIKTAAF